jgi:hypothetical protein
MHITDISQHICVNDFWKMCVIDEKQEAIARIRMTIDNDRKARLELDAMENVTESEVTLDLELESSKTWQLGSPEGKKTNLRIMGADLAKVNSQYCSLDERVREFIACNMPEEAIQLRFEDNIHVSLEFLNVNTRLWLKGDVNSHRCKGINVLS